MAKQAKWKESRRAFLRSLRNGWKIFSRSKIGMAGLGIIVLFLILAIFAPFFTPYSTTYTAPSIDIIRGDIYTQPIPNPDNWPYAPVGINNFGSTIGLNMYLSGVLLYNNHGNAMVYPVTYNYTSQKTLMIHLESPTNYSIPNGINYIEETGTYIISFSNSMTYLAYGEKNFYILDSNFNVYKNYSLPFVPDHRSLFYNNPFIYASAGQYSAIVFTNKSNVILYIFYNRNLNYFGMPVPIHENPLASIEFNLTGNNLLTPLIYLNPNDVNNGYLNTSEVIFATSNGLEAYNFHIKMNPTYLTAGYNVPENVSKPELLWKDNYTYYNDITKEYVSYQPNSITFGYDWGDNPGVQTYVVVGTNSNNIIGYSRATGSIAYVQDFIVANPNIKGYDLQALYPTKSDMIFAVATLGERSVVGVIDPTTGLIPSNRTYYNVLDGIVNNYPFYDIGSSFYLASTSLGNVYLLQQNMRINQTFTVLGGLKTPISGLGNVLSYTSLQGFYYGAITKNGDLFLQETVGTDVAPLPPGTYLSGNTYILGTDAYGHDIWTWVIYGARAELVIGVVAALSSVLLGTFLGLISGFYGGWVDSFIMRLTDIFLSLPVLVIMILLASILGPNIWNIIFVIAILSWSGITRIIRAQVLSLKTRAFIDAARISGASQYRLMMVHIFPNVLPLTFLYMSFGVSGAILTEAALAFLGLGDPTAVTWGMMLQYIWTTGHVLDAPWWLLPPGIAITLLSLAFYLVGRAFDEVINPRLRRR